MTASTYTRGPTCVAASVDGAPVTSVTRAVVRTALTMARSCAAVAGDAALKQGRVTVAEPVDEVATVSPHQGRGRALAAVLDMDEKAESVGESRCRMALQDLGFTIESQVVLSDHHGRFVGNEGKPRTRSLRSRCRWPS